MPLKDVAYSAYGLASQTPAPVNRLMAAFADDFRPGVDINLGVGFVNEDTMPRDQLLKSLEYVLAHPQEHPAALNYGGPRGTQNLIDAIKQFHIKNNILTHDILDRQEIIVGSNGASSLLEGIAQLIKPGLIITSDPIYYIYSNYLERRGFEILAIPEDENGIRTDLLTEKLADLGHRTSDIRFFFIVTVNNPTGSILSNPRRKELVQIVTQLSKDLDRKIPIFFDKAYENLIHDPSVPNPQSPLLYDQENLVYEIGSLSKILAPALRIGYLIGPPSSFITALIQKTSDTGFSAPVITQEMAGYMLNHHVQDQINRVNQGYQKKARAVRSWIDAQLGDALAECRGGQAGFYFYLTFLETQTHEQSPFFNFLARTTGNADIDGPKGNTQSRVIYIPGDFCVHPNGDLVEAGTRQLRLSYGFEELAQIEQAIHFLKEAVAYARQH